MELDPLLIPGLLFLKPHSWAKRSTVLASIAMQNIKEIHCSISQINEKTFKVGYTLLIPGLSILNPIPGPDVAQWWPLSSCKKSKNL